MAIADLKSNVKIDTADHVDSFKQRCDSFDLCAYDDWFDYIVRSTWREE